MTKERSGSGTEKKREVANDSAPLPKKATSKTNKHGNPQKKSTSYVLKRSKEAQSLAREKIRLEKKKGKFKRQNYGKKKRVPDRWRRPRGIDSGHQNDEKHKPAHPRSGYITPRKVRGLHPSGYFPVRVFTPSDLDRINPRIEAVLIASSVGKKKRIEIQRLAMQRGIQILNYKELDHQ